jgi:UDP-galactopyranose mutase
MSRGQNAGKNYRIIDDNSSFERVEEFKYLGTTLTDQNSVHKEIACRVKFGNACYRSVQNVFFPSFLAKI